MALAAIAIYVASRALADALGTGSTHATLWRSFGHALPIGAIAIAAVVAKLDPLAVGVLTASSVMCLTLVAGVAALSTPQVGLLDGASAWPMLSSAALLVLIGALMGGISQALAAGLLLIGGLMLWTHKGQSTTESAGRPTHHPSRSLRSWITILLSAALIVVTALLAIAAVRGISTTGRSRTLTAGMLAATTIAPLLVLPIVGSTSNLAAASGSSSASLSIAVGVAGWNLCLWLPLAGLIKHHRDGSPLALPVGVWRVDAVLLLMLSLWYWPIALGRWKTNRPLGLALVGTYVLFLVYVGTIGWR